MNYTPCFQSETFMQCEWREEKFLNGSVRWCNEDTILKQWGYATETNIQR